MQENTPSPIPTPQVQPTTAPGLRGPRGLSPRTNYTRVNSVTPPEPQDGAEIQKSISPKVGAPMKTASDVTAAARPFSLQDMVKSAMSSALEKVQSTKLAEQASRALAADVLDNGQAKTASYSTEYCTKLASALSFMSEEFEKEASESKQGPGMGPGALEVMEAKGGGGSPGGVNRGVAATTPPVNPPQEKHLSTEHGSTCMGTDEKTPPGGGGTQPQMGKAAAPVELIRKLAQEKKAEDALNPAKIAGPAAVPPDASDSTQPRGSLGGNSSLVSSNESAINYTKGEAKAPAKADVAKVLDEQPMKDGEVLRAAFDNTGKAGTKYAGVADETKVAAARQLLARLAKSGE